MPDELATTMTPPPPVNVPVMDPGGASWSPATSATSDTPPAPEPAPAAETPPAETAPETPPAEATPPAETAPVETPAEAPPTEAKPREDKGVGKVLNAQDAKIAALEAKISELEDGTKAERAHAAQLQAQLNEALLKRTEPEKPPQDTKPPVDLDPRPVRPKRTDFETPDQFDAARDRYEDDLSDWTRREAGRETQRKLDEADAKRAQAETERQSQQQLDDQAKTVLDSHVTRMKAAEEKYPDFKAVAMKEDLPVTGAMAAVLVNSDMGPDILYHLGQHPEEAARIAGMVTNQVFPKGHQLAGQPIPDMQRISFEMGRIAARLSTTAAPAAPAKPVSKAPPPVTPPAGRNTADNTMPPDGGDDYIEKRVQQMRASNRPPHILPTGSRPH